MLEKPIKRFLLASLMSSFVLILFGILAEEVAGGVELDVGLRPSYTCYKVEEESVRIDGRLDEDFWEETPDIEIRDMKTGDAYPYTSKVKMVWGKNYLYLGYVLGDIDVYSISKKRGERFHRLPDLFVKLFLDPDADGIDVVEIHVNAFNNTWECYYEIPNPAQHGDTGAHFDWECRNLKTAVYVDGTLNNPDDIDRGWSVEMAIPWESIARFTIGKCPPSSGDKWAASPQRVCYGERLNRKTRIYGSWPVLGMIDSHIHDRYGIIVFSDEKPKKLRWKLIWVGTSMPQETDAQIEDAVIKAKSLGFNAIAWGTNKWKIFIYACRKHGIESYGTVIPYGIAPQEVQGEESELPDGREKKTGYQFGGEPIDGKNSEICPENFSCYCQPIVLEKTKEKIQAAVRRGYTGIAFDCIGYRNLHGCYCDLCNKLLKNFISPGMSRFEAENRFNEQSLIQFYEKMNFYAKNYAKSLSRSIKTTCHIYPVFLPNILYGNRCPVDYCGQTVSWIFKPHWSYKKVEQYARYIVENEGIFYPESIGAPFIGFWGKGEYAHDAKTTERVRKEIQIVKKAGARAIQFATLGHILAFPEVAKVISEELSEK